MTLDSLNSTVVALVPLGIIGFCRWGIWLLRRFLGFLYRPITGEFKPQGFSIVTPVYKEDPAAFMTALESWLDNGPTEVVAVIDAIETECIRLYKARAAADTGGAALRLIVTTVPGKRAALAAGIRQAQGEIVALVDSDTSWELGTTSKLLAPFQDSRVGGVTCKQAIYDPKSLSEKLAAIVFELRYADELPFLGFADQGFSCLSGRTAVYRRENLLPLLDDMVGETFWGQPCISGEDKRLTYLLQATGVKTKYQGNVTVSTYASRSFGTFLKQKVRWSRNSWRADLRALGQRWTWKRPLLAAFLIDKCISSCTVLISPLIFFFCLYEGSEGLALAIAGWWLVSRFLKILPYLQRRPRDIWLLPIFVLFGFLIGVLKLYALFSLNRQGWLTKTRVGQPRLVKFPVAAMLGPYVGTAGVVAALLLLIVSVRGIVSAS